MHGGGESFEKSSDDVPGRHDAGSRTLGHARRDRRGDPLPSANDREETSHSPAGRRRFGEPRPRSWSFSALPSVVSSTSRSLPNHGSRTPECPLYAPTQNSKRWQHRVN